MSDTPETWRDTFTVNTVTDGIQEEGAITQLTDGRILVTWTSSSDAGAGAPPSNDVIGQFYDPLGNPLGEEFLVNEFRGDTERFSAIAGTAQGGFIVAYADLDGSLWDIRLGQYDDTNTNLGTVNVTSDFDGSGVDYIGAQVAVSSATSALVAYIDDGPGGDDQVFARIYDPETQTLGPETYLYQNGSGSRPIYNLDVTALANGNYVVTTQNETGSDDEIWFRIVSADGTPSTLVQIPATDGNDYEDFDPSITALTDGGFVVTWRMAPPRGSSDRLVAKMQVFDSSGQTITGATVVHAGPGDYPPSQEVVALADGGFIVLYNEDGSLEGRRFEVSGSNVRVRGDAFTAFGEMNGRFTPDSILLEDGRVMLTLTPPRSITGEQVEARILDPRGDVNAAPAYTPDSKQIGTVGADVFAATADEVYGYAGNDSITGDNGADAIFGGSGDDFILGGFGRDRLFGNDGADVLRGGSGIDRVWGGAGDDKIAGQPNNDILYGEQGDDALWGGAGDDWMRGDAGNDFVFGGKGDDVLLGSDGADRLQGRGGNDWHAGQGGNDILRGGAGSDTLRGGIGLDRLAGGPDDDIFEFSASDTNTDFVFDFAKGDKLSFQGYSLTKWGIAWRATDNGRHTFVDPDGDGNAEVVLLNFVGLTADDFV